MRLRIDLKIFIFLVLFYLTKQIEIYAIIMLFAIIHELGHLLAGLILKMKPEKLELMPFGLTVSFKIDVKEYNKKIKNGNKLAIKKILVALAGPITNMIIALALSNINIEYNIKQTMIYANILIALFNLLPIYPLDGGRILKGVLHIIFGIRKSRKYTNEISIMATTILTAISSIAIYYFENISIFLIIMYLWMIVLLENKKYKRKMKIYEIINNKNMNASIENNLK